jgi:hypothetical protein
VKLAFVTPAMMRVAIPHDVLLMNCFLALSFSRYRCETFLLITPKSTAEIFKDAPQSEHRARDN